MFANGDKRLERTPPGMEENPEGEWGKWEDYEDEIKKFTICCRQDSAMIEALKSEIRELRCSTITAADGVLKVRDVTPCNCEEWYNREVRVWLCPRHGYKKR